MPTVKLRKEDPGTLSGKYVHKRTIAEQAILKRNPGEWFVLIEESGTRPNATQHLYRLEGKKVSAKSVKSYQVTVRRLPNNKYRAYARYIGK